KRKGRMVKLLFLRTDEIDVLKDDHAKKAAEERDRVAKEKWFWDAVNIDVEPWLTAGEMQKKFGRVGRSDEDRQETPADAKAARGTDRAVWDEEFWNRCVDENQPLLADVNHPN